mgnify:CR=1 FL=1
MLINANENEGKRGKTRENEGKIINLLNNLNNYI